MTVGSVRLTAGAERAPIRIRVGQVFEHVRSRCARIFAADPEAVMLEAEVVATLAEELHGEGDLHHGHRSKAAWREVRKGKRAALLADLLRLVRSKRPKGRAAVVAVLTLVAGRLGLRLVAIGEYTPAEVKALRERVERLRLMLAEGEAELRKAEAA